LSPSTASSDTDEEREEQMSSDSPTVTELLLQILGRLGDIEERLSSLEDLVSELSPYGGSDIGNRRNQSGTREQGPITGLGHGVSKRVGRTESPGLLTEDDPK
jgi:hypothetical protein